MFRSAIVPVLLGLALAASCGPAPVPVETAAANRSPQADPHAGMNMKAPPLPAGTSGELPEGHPPIGGGMPAIDVGDDVRFGGVVRLQGDLATAAEGYIFISVKPEGIRMPSFSARYALADAEPLADGERVLNFEIDKSNLMGGLVPGALVMEAYYDPDGFVESKEGIVRASVPTEVGDMQAEIVLGS